MLGERLGDTERQATAASEEIDSPERIRAYFEGRANGGSERVIGSDDNRIIHPSRLPRPMACTRAVVTAASAGGRSALTDAADLSPHFSQCVVPVGHECHGQSDRCESVIEAPRGPA